MGETKAVKAQKLGFALARRLPEIRRASYILAELADYQGDIKELLVDRWERRKLTEDLGRLENALMKLRERASLEGESRVVKPVLELEAQQ